jgi:hypothetical protein
LCTCNLSGICKKRVVDNTKVILSHDKPLAPTPPQGSSSLSTEGKVSNHNNLKYSKFTGTYAAASILAFRKRSSALIIRTSVSRILSSSWRVFLSIKKKIRKAIRTHSGMLFGLKINEKIMEGRYENKSNGNCMKKI